MRGPLPAVALVMLVAVAGCLNGDDVAPDGDGAGPVAPPAAAFGAPVAVSTEWPGAEPVVAVAPDGTIYVEGVGFAGEPARRPVNHVWRSQDDGATWEDVTPPHVGTEGSFDAFVAVGPGGRVYAANSGGGVLNMWASDDRGGTWDVLPMPPWPFPMHRMWVVPAPDGAVHVISESLSPEFTTWYLRSPDEGRTWGVPLRVATLDGFGSDLALDPASGNLYLARFSFVRFGGEEGAWHLLSSSDAGVTWTSRPMFPLEGRLASSWQSLEVDAAGTLWMAWSATVSGGRAVAHVAWSDDGGGSWSGPLALTDLPGTHAMPWIRARGPGEVGLVYYAADADGHPGDVSAAWHVDHARVVHTAEGARIEGRVRLTPEPIHRGNICVEGPTCGNGEDRRLLDYPWIDVGPDGRDHVVFASTAWARPNAFAVYAGQRPAT